jgi:DNA-binding NtrC family response regulator
MSEMKELNVEVLLVDDDEMTLFIHEKILDRCSLSHPYQSFSSGEACLEHILDEANKGKKFIVLLDINMPGISGWGVLDELNAVGMDKERYLVIMATSSVDYEDRVKASEYSNVIDFFEKPLTISSCESLANLPEVASF